jgi:hypothetical protein
VSFQIDEGSELKRAPSSLLDRVPAARSSSDLAATPGLPSARCAKRQGNATGRIELVSGELIGVRQEERVTVITLQRQDKLNALSTALEGELLAAIAEEAVRKSRCIVFVGAGKAFSAGAPSTSSATSARR